MKKFLLGISSYALPVFALAADRDPGFGSIQSSIQTATNIINSLVPLVIGIALLLFLIGIVQFVTAGGDEEKRVAARGMIIFGIIALFVMTAVWGFVRILTTTIFGNNPSLIVNPPAVPSAPVRNSQNPSLRPE